MELTLTELKEDPTPIKEAFFDAMLDGYFRESGNPKYTDSWKMPDGTIRSIYEMGDFVVKDRFLSMPYTNYSFGSTFITLAGASAPIWHMQYWGLYPESCIPIMRAACRTAYKERLFRSGRGPATYETEDGQYESSTHPGMDRFSLFRGNEVVLAKSTNERGWHHIQGGLLI